MSRKRKIDIGSRVRQLRLTRGIGQEELATKVGLTGDALNHIEKGRRPLYLDQLDKVAEVFNVPVAAFLSEGDFHEARLLYGWRALKGKTTLKRDLLKFIEAMAERGGL